MAPLKYFSGWGSTPDSRGEAYSALPDSLAGGEGLATPFPRTPPTLSALWVSPLIRNRLGPSQHGGLDPPMLIGRYYEQFAGSLQKLWAYVVA